MSDQINVMSGASVTRASFAQHEGVEVKGNCEVTVTNEKGFRTFEARQADHGEKARGQFTKLVEVPTEGKSGVHRYWMSPDDAANLNIRRLSPSKIEVSK